MKNRTGEKHLTKEGYTVEIIEHFSALNCTIQFEQGVVVKNRSYADMVKGKVKNLYHPSVFCVGYYGIGIYKMSIKGKATKTYQTWQNMLQRCYDENYQEKCPTYKDVTVCVEWHNFQNFAEWFESNYNSETMQGWHLDKDILFKGNKIYSLESCYFLPPQINTLFIKCDSARGEYPVGVSKVGDNFVARLRINGKNVHLGYFSTPKEAFQAYKTAKENQIKCVANEWKDKITEPTYQALVNYQVEITD